MTDATNESVEPGAPDTDTFDLDLSAEAAEVKTFKVKVSAEGDYLVFPAKMEDWPLEAIDLMGTQGHQREGIAKAAVLEEDETIEDVIELLNGFTFQKLDKLLSHLELITGTTPGKSNRSGRRSASSGTK